MSASIRRDTGQLLRGKSRVVTVGGLRSVLIHGSPFTSLSQQPQISVSLYAYGECSRLTPANYQDQHDHDALTFVKIPYLAL